MIAPFDYAHSDVRDPAGDPKLDALYARFKDTLASLQFEETAPKQWLGLYINDDLKAAYGGYIAIDGTIVVTAAICDPTKVGLQALAALGIMVGSIRQNHRIIFYVDAKNRRMRFIANRILGAKKIADMMEL